MINMFNLLVITEMQTKPTMRYNYTTTKMAKIKYTDNIRY